MIRPRSPCPICGAMPTKPMFAIREEAFWYYCAACGTGYGRPVAPGVLRHVRYDEAYYKENYLSKEGKYLAQGHTLLEMASPYMQGGTLLDIGAGCGAISSVFAASGWKVEIVEPSEAGRGIALSHYGLAQQHSMLENISASDRYDMILISDTMTSIEHLAPFLETAVSLLRKNGLLLMKNSSRNRFYLQGVGLVAGLQQGVAGTLLDWPLCFNTFTLPSYQHIQRIFGLELIESRAQTFPIPVLAPLAKGKWKMCVVSLLKIAFLSIGRCSTHLAVLFRKIS